MISINVSGIEYRFFNHAFAVSSCGKVLRKLEPYSPTQRRDGYWKCGSAGLLHRMVAKCWLENPRERKLVHHKNGDKGCNGVDNLEWVTPKEHMAERHKGKSGRYIRTAETKEKIRAFRTGFKDSPEVAERKRKVLDANCPKRPCEIDGIYFRSIRTASIALNIHVSTVRQRCFSKHFVNYKLLDK